MARLRCPWAAAGPGRSSRRLTRPHISDPTPLVWRPPEVPEGQAAAPVGGGEAWPGFEPTRSAMHSDTAPPVWRAPEGPEGTGGLRGAAPNEVRP